VNQQEQAAHLRADRSETSQTGRADLADEAARADRGDLADLADLADRADCITNEISLLLVRHISGKILNFCLVLLMPSTTFINAILLNYYSFLYIV